MTDFISYFNRRIYLLIIISLRYSYFLHFTGEQIQILLIAQEDHG